MIGQTRKSGIQIVRDQLAKLGITRVQTTRNDYDRLIAIAYRDERKVAETGIDSEMQAERKILAMLTRDPGADKRRQAEDKFVRNATRRAQKHDA